MDPYTVSPYNRKVTFSSNAPFTPSYVVSQLSLSSDPTAMYASRVRGRQMLLDNPARESRTKKEMDEKRLRRKKQKESKSLGIIGKREAKEKGVWKFDESQAKFALFVPMHNLWMGYMSELLGLSRYSASVSSPQTMPGSSGMHPKLLKADFHGSIMTVHKAKNPCLVGISGIVIHETENAFKVVTRQDKVKLIPKQNSIFTFAVPLYSTLPATHKPDMPLPLPPVASGSAPMKTVLDGPYMEFELYGNQFRFRSADRAGRKFKHKETIEL